MTEEEPTVVLFEMRNDKDRGNLILTILSDEDENVWFFKYHHQTVRQHPEKIQQIVSASRLTTRTKTIKVDISEFRRQYWNGASFEFKGVELNSVGKEIAKVFERLVNKEVGALKRKQTIVMAKEDKSEAKSEKIRKQKEKDEAAFQNERAKRIADLMKISDAME